MRRFLPESIAGGTIVILVAGLALSHLVSLIFHFSERHDALTLLGEGQIAERIATITSLVSESPPIERPGLVAPLNGPTLRVFWKPVPAEGVTHSQDWRAVILKTALVRLLDNVPDESVWVDIAEPIQQPHSAASNFLDQLINSREDLLHHHFRRMAENVATGTSARVAIALPDGSSLNFAAPIAGPTSLLSWHFVVSMAIMIVSVIILSVWAVRRMTAPLAVFSDAAQRLGRDVAAPPLPEDGPSEIRQAAQAFNDMQSRIRRFVEDRTQMIAAISHDLRTPITRLRLRAEFIEDGDERRKMLVDLEEMERMITGTLAFARDDAAVEPRESMDLVTLVQRVVDDAVDAGMPVTFEGANRIPYAARPTALRRALTNLVENAVRHGRKASVLLQTVGGHIVIQIDDNGPGIPPEHLDDVFRPFFRLDRSRSRETGGVGLGLTVARTIIHAHGGEIVLRNRPGGGLTAEVRLPR